MKKIMFSDKFKLTEAVLDGRKTMTRRLVVSITTSDGAVHHVDKTVGSYHEYMGKDGKVCLAWSPYKVGDVVAAGQGGGCGASCVGGVLCKSVQFVIVKAFYPLPLMVSHKFSISFQPC